MTRPNASVDYNSAVPSLRARQLSPNGVQDDLPASESPAAGTATPQPRHQDLASVKGFLQLLARAVSQYRTCPAASPLCVDAIAACHKVRVSHDGRDQMVFRVTSRELLIDELGIGAGTIVEHELVRRLHRARVSALSIERAASPRDLSRFCRDLIAVPDGAHDTTTLDELLVEHGVDTIVVRPA